MLLAPGAKGCPCRWTVDLGQKIWVRFHTSLVNFCCHCGSFEIVLKRHKTRHPVVLNYISIYSLKYTCNAGIYQYFQLSWGLIRKALLPSLSMFNVLIYCCAVLMLYLLNVNMMLWCWCLNYDCGSIFPGSVVPAPLSTNRSIGAK